MGYDLARSEDYGTISLTEADPAQEIKEPLELAEVKQYLRIDDGVTGDDALIETLISGARSQAELLQKRVLVRKQFDLVHDYWPARILLGSPTVSVDLVQYTDRTNAVTVMQSSGYFVDLKKEPAVLLPAAGQSWPVFSPSPSSAVLVRYTAGYAFDSPFWSGPGARIKNGMLLLISSWYDQRTPFVLGQSVVPEYPFAVTACLTYGARQRVSG